MPPDSGTTPRLAKPGRSLADVGHQPHVGAEREVEAVARRGAVDDGDHRRVHLLQHDGGQVAGLRERRRRAAASADPPMPVPAMASLMSRPEQNPLPAPVRSTTRTSGLSSALANSSVSSISIRPEMALRRWGRFRVMVATWSVDLVEDLGPVALVRLGGAAVGGVSHRATR